MLSMEATDLEIANLDFSISDNGFNLNRKLQECYFGVNQYYLNNTCYEITIMDNLGIRQTIPRNSRLSGEKVFTIIREYRISTDISKQSKDFFDEVGDDDGIVLESLKEYFNKNNFFRYGFTDNYKSTSRNGLMFNIEFSISEKQLQGNEALQCDELGFVVSRLKRQVMPINPIYSTSNHEGNYNPYRRILGKSYTMYRICANYNDSINEKYYYTLAGSTVEVEYIKNRNLKPGLYVFKLNKNMHDYSTQCRKVFFVDFDKVNNKNGFFTSDRDAMLSVNIENSIRAQEHEIKTKEFDFKKQEFDFRNREHLNKVQESELGSKQKMAEMHLKLTEIDKQVEMLIKKSEYEKAKQETEFTKNILEKDKLEREEQLAKKQFDYKVKMIDLDNEKADKEHTTKTVESSVKLASSLSSLSSMFIKLLT